MLRTRAGLVFQAPRRPTLEAAATRVMHDAGMAAPTIFVPHVARDIALFDELVAQVTIGETYFFRESAHFTVLRDRILPHFCSVRSADQKFRAWSAGCSTGEEAYSIAIALREEGVASHVTGTDISRARLAAARKGSYRKWSFRGVPDATVAKYFRRDADSYVLSATVRREVDFQYLNLAEDVFPAMSTGVWAMDLILCRNVLIYFDRETIARVAKALLATLSEDGWLLVSATDPPLGDVISCEVVQTEAGFAYRRNRRARLTSPVRNHVPLSPPVTWAEPTEPVPSSAIAEAPASLATLQSFEVDKSPSAAEIAYARRDYEGAIAIVAGAAHEGVAPIADLIVYIRALANLGRFEEAGVACATALDRYRDSARLHYLHAKLVGQGGLFAESARAAKRALYLDRSMVVAHLALGEALVRASDADGARRAFAAAERILRTMAPEEEVPFSDGEPAGRLLEITLAQSAPGTRTESGRP